MRIVKGTSNKVRLTLAENSDSSSEWIMKMTNRVTGHSKVFALQEVANEFQQDRCNWFNVTESSTENLGYGVVSLSPSGQWDYTVYEMAVSSPKNLNPDDAIGIVEMGWADVVDTTENQRNYFTDESDRDCPVFNVE